MLYKELTVNGKDYKFRLDAKNAVALERKLGRNPLDIFNEMSTGSLPKLEEVIYILQYSLQKFNHGFDLDKTYDLYEQMIDSDIDFSQIVLLVYEILNVSFTNKLPEGLETKEISGEESPKN
jgi:hypothetical protein